MKKYVLISGLDLNEANRGTAALGYGSIAFCEQKGYLNSGQNLINISFVKKFWKKEYRNRTECITISGKNYNRHLIFPTIIEKLLLEKLGFVVPFTKFGKALKEIELVACINGGDGFSDIYNTDTFKIRLVDTFVAMKVGIPVIQLPQTLGPFSLPENYKIAEKILKYSKEVFVRDDKFVNELDKMEVRYSLTKDLSSYMKPEPIEIDIDPNSIGINVSGLTYSNRFRTLSGQFETYPELINRLICHFRDKRNKVYLIPHSYRFGDPEENNDDYVACQEAYDKLEDKSNVVFVDRNLTAPQVKYVISKMSFFIGTRMHANFAAIYTGVPLFGLAYSYKFEGAFNANGLDGKAQTAVINNMKPEDIEGVILKIETYYQSIQ